MKLKARYLRHPRRTASVAKTLLTTQMNMLRFARHGERRFGKDPRYDLQCVTDGYAPHIDESDDTVLLHRICTAYNKAVEQQEFASDVYCPTVWWEQVRRDNLAPVMQALVAHDTVALQSMYRRFFRDACGSGLFQKPLNLSKATFGNGFKDVGRRFILGDALHRIDYWKTQVGHRFTISDLAGPEVGNPFGVMIEGTLVRTGTEYQHYCAERIRRLLKPGFVTVAEIGGGFGGMAYYLLREAPEITYLDFDVPESIALTSYYLIKSFPHLSFFLFGEDDSNDETGPQFNVALLPLYELPELPNGSVDFMFSSHAMSDISQTARGEYLHWINHATMGNFLHIGNRSASASIRSLIGEHYPSFLLVESSQPEWNKHRISGAHELELLYRVG
jgi:hypothetical protein